MAAAAGSPDARPLQGRGTVYVVGRPGGGAGKWVVRHYHRGGAVARHLGDRYLRLGIPRPIREFRVSARLQELGIPSPAPVGAAVYPAGIWYRGDLVTEWIPRSRDLAGVLFEGASAEGGLWAGSADAGAPGVIAARRAAAMESAGRLIRRLHDAGVRHPDLNLKNILIVDEAGGPEALVIDLDGARLGSPVGAAGRRRMIDRFWRSARKWERRTGRSLPAGARSAFEAGYGG